VRPGKEPDGRILNVTAVTTRISVDVLTGKTPSGDVLPSPAYASGVLLALTHDQRLIEALRTVADPQHPVNTVGSEIDLAAALMTQSCGVALLDAGAVATPIWQLAGRLNSQFPDLVLVAAGGLDDQGALANLIADGSVHRFVHKPVSEQRVRLFVGAAWRRHEELLAGVRAAATAHPPRNPASTTRGWLIALTAAAAVAAPLAWRALQEPSASGAPAAAHATRTTSASDATLEDLLARADRALEAGALVSPPGANAAQLYREALGHNARDLRAANGLEQVIDKLLAAADEQLKAGHLDAAQQLCDAARAVNPEHPRAAFLAAQIGAQRERAVLAQAQRAAARGDVEGAMAVLDNAARGSQPSTLATEARAELARQQLDARVAQFLRSGRDALDHGQLIEPTEQNARFYIESARALSPDNPDVQQAQQDLLARLVAEANKALAAGNADRSDYWAAAALDAGADHAQVTALRASAEHQRSATSAETLAHLSMLFNQRLAQGRLVEPETDSAKFYLAQLVQADAAHPSTQLAHAAFTARLLDEARSARSARDYPLAQRWLAQARLAGADSAAAGLLEAQLTAAQTAAQTASAQTDSFVSAGSLTQTHYVSPLYPPGAQAQRLGGWVDVQFMVAPDGSVGNASIVGAQPVGVFEHAALDAVRHWRYQPLTQDGHAITQRARVRVLFEAPQ
jgi:periplasmic protein TonB